MTEPGLGFIAAHILLSVAVGGAALAVSGTMWVLTFILKMTQILCDPAKIKNPRLARVLHNRFVPLYMTSFGLVLLAGIALAHGFVLRPVLFLSFATANVLFTLPFNKKIPIDNLFFVTGMMTASYLAGEAVLPLVIIAGAGILSLYNLLKKSGNRNLGRPKLWFAASNLISAFIGLSSGHPAQFLPSIGLLIVAYVYAVGMEAREAGLLKKYGI